MRREGHHRPHHMLDQQDGETALTIDFLKSFDQAIRLCWPQACHHLIEQEQFRIVASARATSSRFRSGSVSDEARCARFEERSSRRRISTEYARAAERSR